MAIRKLSPGALKLHIQTEESLYTGYFLPCVKALVKAKADGSYSEAKADQAFRKVVVKGSLEIAKEYGGKLFTKSELRECVRLLRLDFENVYRNKGYRNLD